MLWTVTEDVTMSRAFWLACFAVPLFLGAASLPAQDDPCTTRTVPVTVVDRQGNPVTGLTTANFRGKFRGKPVEILSVNPDTRPRRIVIVADASGSMVEGEDRKWGLVPAIAAQMFRLAPSYSRFALIVFSSEILLKLGFDQPMLVLTKALAALPDEPSKHLKVPRKTALFDAMVTAAKELSPPIAGDVIFVISDAGDNYSKTHADELESTIIPRGIRIFVCIPESELVARTRTPEEVYGPDTMKKLVRATGGNLYSFNSWSSRRNSSRVYAEESEQVSRMLSVFAQQMGQFDRLEIRLANPVDKPRDWKLEVVGENGKPRRDLTVLYPHKLMPCNAGQKNN